MAKIKRRCFPIGPLRFTSGTLTEQQIATMDYIILLDEFRAELLRAPARAAQHDYQKLFRWREEAGRLDTRGRSSYSR